ncbi:MAG: type I restriction endonuclease subunit R, partial [Anaerolineae bacterium]
QSEQSLDLVLFLNGLPIFTAELKNPLTGQTVRNAKLQYRYDRDPREPLLRPGRCIAHWAVDPNEAYFTTELAGGRTRFYPFNRGHGRGAGNPPPTPDEDYATSYLWRDVWARDSVLNLVQRFVRELDPAQRRKKDGSRVYIFPRYHQLRAVRRLLADARQRGAGQRYLVQHSAGSGKTYTIAWLAHQLTTLHDAQDRRVFDSIVVVTDRRVLDRQMQVHVQQFERQRGLVAVIDKHSRQLREALEQGRQIIVSTIQKFPVIVDEVEGLPGQRFAVIIDEAHSSQGGTATQSLRKILAQAALEADDPDLITAEDTIQEIAAQQRLPNVSLFAFTATPRPETLQLFGTPNDKGQREAYDLYPMKQAIEEEFILDVLQQYATYDTYWRLAKRVEEDPAYKERVARKLLRQYVREHPRTIAEKITVIVEHFQAHVTHQIGGQAKAMICTGSRLEAARYYRQLCSYLAQQGYPYRALVAFSDEVTDPDSGELYSEPRLNRAEDGTSIADRAIAEAFERPEYRFLVVANKFQTGFDQPLLYAMYVDKVLSGLQAVQTLSRLNRSHPQKDGTVVLDFRNDAETIEKAFAPYYTATILAEDADPNMLYRIEQELYELGFFTAEEVKEVAALLEQSNASSARLYAALRPVLQRFHEAIDEGAKRRLRTRVNDFVRMYGFFSQVMTFVDPALLRLHRFCRVLRRILPGPKRERLPHDIMEKVALDALRLEKGFEGTIALDDGNGQVDIGEPSGTSPEPEDVRARLSRIIQELNEIFGLNIPGDRGAAFVEELVESVSSSDAMLASLQANPEDVARLTFDTLADDYIEDSIYTYQRVYKALNDKPEIQRRFMAAVWPEVQRRTSRGMGAGV